MTIFSDNPLTGERVATGLAETSGPDVAAACAAAARAARELAGRPLAWRAEFLESIALALEGDADAIVADADAETGLGATRLRGELARTCFQFRFFADVVRDGGFLEASIDHPYESPMGPLPDLRRQLEPLGVVGVFGASNFPLAFSVPGGDTASALAAGCSVVIKAHPAHPLTSWRTFSCLASAAAVVGAPEGTLALVFGLDAGRALVSDEHVAAVGFTGSLGAGRALFDLAQSRAVPIPFYGELGSVNPLVVTPAAAAQRGASLGAGLVASVTLGSGQFCTKPGLLFVPAGEAGDRVVDAAVAALEGASGATMLTTQIRDRFESGVERLEGVGATSRLALSARATSEAGSFAALYQMDLDSLTGAREAVMTEYFGALAIVVRYDGLKELLEALDSLEAALTFSVHVGEGDGPHGPDEAAPALLALGARRAGRVIVNGYPTGVGVSWSMHHGGPYPASTDALHTSVGASAVRRWLRPVSYQGVPAAWLPAALRDDNPLNVPQRVDGVLRARREE